MWGCSRPGSWLFLVVGGGGPEEPPTRFRAALCALAVCTPRGRRCTV